VPFASSMVATTNHDNNSDSLLADFAGMVTFMTRETRVHCYPIVQVDLSYQNQILEGAALMLVYMLASMVNQDTSVLVTLTVHNGKRAYSIRFNFNGVACLVICHISSHSPQQLHVSVKNDTAHELHYNGSYIQHQFFMHLPANAGPPPLLVNTTTQQGRDAAWQTLSHWANSFTRALM